MDLLAAIVLTLLLVPLALLTEGPLRVGLGLLFLLFFPGYTLIAALFSRRDSFDMVERVVLSFALSIAIVPLIGLVLNYTPWGITTHSVVVTTVLFIILASAAALYRRWRVAKEERFEIRLHIGRLEWKRWSKLNTALSAVLVLSVLGTIGVLVYTVDTLKERDRFTEFYVLSSQGTADGFPQELLVGQPGEVILGLENHEHQTTTYRIEAWIAGTKIQDIGPISLTDGEKWEEKFTFVPTSAGQDQELDFWLYKGAESEIYREVHLWLDVEEAP